MKMMFEAHAKKLFGAKYERLIRTILVDLIVFWGLHIADFQIQIAPSVLYLMVSTFTAGVMWQALSSEDNAANIQNMFMLPFEGREFVFSYVAALGAYTLLTKTAALLAVVLAISVWSRTEIMGSILCAVNGVLMTAAVFSLKKYWYAGGFWAAGLIAAILSVWDTPRFLPMITVNSILAILLLQCADGYSFYLHGRKGFHRRKSGRIVRSHKHYSVWRYLFRYLKDHTNYLMNTVIMWGVACVLPLFFKQMEGLFVIPLGYAILSLNTPLCILLSCDPALEQAVRFLPGGRWKFGLPYCLFIFMCNVAADGIFLCSWQIQVGGVTVLMIVAAVFFALQSAVFSILLEWFYPIRGWKIESDLWHHPRKYIVPVAMLLLAGIVGIIPKIVPVLIVLLVIEIVIIFFSFRRC